MVRHPGRTSGLAFSGILRHWRSSGTHFALYIWHADCSGKPAMKAHGLSCKSNSLGIPAAHTTRANWNKPCSGNPRHSGKIFHLADLDPRPRSSSVPGTGLPALVNGCSGKWTYVTRFAWKRAGCSGKWLLQYMTVILPIYPSTTQLRDDII